MKATELRLGNFVSHLGHVVEITMSRYIGDFHEGILELSPIPLTEEWLVKFGFEISWHINDGSGFGFSKHKKDYFVIFHVKQKGFRVAFRNENGRIEIPVKYVHQLQNLYFALNGEELTIKETVNA